MAFPENYSVVDYFPTEEDFEIALKSKQTGNRDMLESGTWFDDSPFYYTLFRRFLAVLLLDWTAATKDLYNRIIIHTGYDKSDIIEIINWLKNNKQYYINSYNKVINDAKNTEQPEVLVKQARDARKGEITVNVKNPSGGFFRVMPYSLKYGSDDPTKKQSGSRMHLYFGKKEGNLYKIVVRGMKYGSGKSDEDEPLFATEQEARDFIANIDNQHLNTKVDLTNWRFVISDRPLEGAWNPTTQKYEKINSLDDAVKVDTICGPAWILRSSDYCVESLQEKIVKLGSKWQVQSEKGRNMGTYDTKKEAQKRLGQVEYFKHMNEEVSKDLEDKIRSVIGHKETDDWHDGKAYLFEISDESKNSNNGDIDPFWIEKFDDDEVDFSKLKVYDRTPEEKEDGKYIATFMISGGKNGSGEWTEYLSQLADAFKAIKEKTGTEPLLYKIDTDIADDVWTGYVFLYDHDDNVKESLNEDLIVIEPFEAKEKIEEIKKQIEDAEDWKVRKNLLALMNIYLFQTIYDADHQDETDCNIDKEDWEGYSDWAKEQAEELSDGHPELEKEDKEREAKIEASVEDNGSAGETEEKIEEDIEKHDTLNPKLFDNNYLKPEVRQQLLNIVDVFLGMLEDNEIKIDVEDVILTGSSASYNYNKDSDIDLHIIVDTSKFDCPDDLYPKLYDAYKSIFNSKYDISIYGIPVEIYVETNATGHVSNGIYSLKKDAWVQEPVETTIPDIDWEEFMKAFKPWEDEYFEIANNIDPEESTDEKPIDDFITKVYELRHTGLANEGQYGFSNLIFKELRSRGYLQNLKDLRTMIMNNKMTLETLNEASYIDDKSRHIYRTKISQIAHDQPIIQNNGIFQIYNVKADDADTIVRLLQREDWIEHVSKTASKFDFSKINFNGVPSRYYTISGKIKL